ncbi:MAG: hypothetical protein U0J42_10095 [[Bacteroides] pectinophilus]|nr:hypothetical protein [[Bacteroides] pectinophilus]
MHLKKIWAVIYAVMLAVFSTFVLLDAFVIPKDRIKADEPIQSRKITEIRQKTYAGRVADIAECIYNSGVAALTVSSMLRGIMDIAGTGSVYQVWMLYAGTVMAAAGAVIFVVAVLAGKGNGSRKYNQR